MSDPTDTGECTSCPEVQAANRQSGYAHIIYTGGPAHAQYLVLRQLIPPRNPEIVTKHGWPSILNSGSIAYTGGEAPPPPEGFAVVAPGVFQPQWPFCPYKMLRAQLQDTGQLDVAALCCHPPSGKADLKPLLLADCQQCAVRPVERTARSTKGRPSKASHSTT